MLNLTNCKIRYNLDTSNRDLLGWAECLDAENGVFYNNIKIKLKKKEDGLGMRVTLDFPAKVVKMQDGVEKKIFFVKPINATSYKVFERVVVLTIKDDLRRKNEKGNL